MSAKHVHPLGRLVFPLALLGCLLLSACAGSSPAQSAPPSSAAKPPPFAAKLKPLLEARMQQLRIPGAIVYVNDPGQGSWTTALGMGNLASRQPMQVTNYMRVGSIAKTFTATVILQLVDQHKLGLDDPVSTYQPQVPNGAHITIRQLLNMSSGLFTYDNDEGYIQTSLADPYKVWTPQELLAIAFKHQPVFAPGKGYLYDNTNYILLGLIMEQLTHLPAEQTWQRYLFGPLGMHQTSMAPPSSSAIPDPQAQGYIYGTEFTGSGPLLNVTDRNPSWAWTAEGAISTLHDLQIWVKALATGTLLSAAMQRQRLTFVPFTWDGQPFFWLGHRAGYGLGIMDFAGMIGHAGDIPGYSSFVGYDPQKHATIVVLTNSNYNASGNFDAPMLEMVIQQELFACHTQSLLSTKTRGAHRLEARVLLH